MQATKENESDSANQDNSNAISENLVGDLNNYRIMCYQDKAPIAPEGKSH